MDREMKGNNSLRVNYAVSEVLGGVLLLFIAIVTFVTICNYIFPLPIQSAEPNVEFVGYVNAQGYAVIEHKGGDPLYNYQIYVNNELTYENDGIDPWEIGEIKIPSTTTILENTNDQIKVSIYSVFEDNTRDKVFEGLITGRTTVYDFNGTQGMLFSSLRTNTVDEDLLCAMSEIVTNIDPLTYICRWMVNGYSLYDVYLAFDTNKSNFTKDYSGNGYDGTVIDAAWTPNGISGGAYEFDGGGDYIALDSLPSVFNELTRNDFSISLWANIYDVQQPHMVLVEAGMDSTNFVKIVQNQEQIYFAVYVLKGKIIDMVVETPVIVNDTWYHIVGTWDSDRESLKLYLNGLLVDADASDQRGVFSFDADDGCFWIGKGQNYFEGMIDEFQIFSRTLSAEQVYQMYITTLLGNIDITTLVSQETKVGDIWRCIVIPNDGQQDGDEVWSNVVEIVDYEGGD